jgi:hypothetical protein
MWIKCSLFNMLLLCGYIWNEGRKIFFAWLWVLCCACELYINEESHNDLCWMRSSSDRNYQSVLPWQHYSCSLCMPQLYASHSHSLCMWVRCIDFFPRFFFIVIQVHCGQVADKYVEYELALKVMDLILHRPAIYRHYLFNTFNHEHRVCMLKCIRN